MKPVLQAIILAEHIYCDEGTGKKVIAGTFNRYFISPTVQPVKRDETSHAPAQMPLAAVLRAGNPFAYVSLTEVRGSIEVKIRLVSLQTNEVCFESSPIPIQCNDPLSSVELALPIMELPHKPGDYALELLCEDEIIGSHRIKGVEQPLKSA